jgi:UDP-N-acetylmuramoyl-tripeptide--D-alanyl-D-alanine ligase
MKFEIRDILKATGGRLLQGPGGGSIKGISADTRTIRQGEIFFALKGPRFDGHSFLGDVVSKGASGAVVEEEIKGLPSSLNVILVEDTIKALGDLAFYVRAAHSIPLVAVSGSSGKTTTKEMIASVLGIKRTVLKTEGNRNNTIGLPLTLFGLNNVHDAAVVELGISELGEMKRLAQICRPDVAVITNIGRGHLETLGTVEGVAKAKGELFTSLSPAAVRVVNLDDPMVVKVSEETEAMSKSTKKVTFGSIQGADVHIKDFSLEGPDDLKVNYGVRGEHLSVRFRSPLVCNVYNGAAAIAATLPLSPKTEEIVDGLNSFSTLRGRMELVMVGGLTVLDDTYNANPESMAAALETLGRLAGTKAAMRPVAVLGDMLELGEGSTDAHREVGRTAGRLGLDVLIAVGQWADVVRQGALESGMNEENVHCFNHKTPALSAMKVLLGEGDVVLVKGSRATAMEEIIEGLKNLGS